MTQHMKAGRLALRALFSAAAELPAPLPMLLMLPSICVGFAAASYNHLEMVRDRVPHQAIVGTCVQKICYEAVAIGDRNDNQRYELLIHPEESPSWPDVAGHYRGYARVESSLQDIDEITHRLSVQLKDAANQPGHSQGFQSVLMTRVGQEINGSTVERRIEAWSSAYKPIQMQAASKDWSDFGTMIAQQGAVATQVYGLPDKPYGPFASAVLGSVGTLIGLYALSALGAGAGPAFSAYKNERRRQKETPTP